MLRQWRAAPAMPLTVSIVEDSSDTREHLAALLESTLDLRCQAAYATGEQAVAGIPSAPPDIVLVDIKLPGMSGIECVAKLRAAVPALRILMLTTYEESDLIFDSLRAGANGYLLKSMAPEELLEAFATVQAGGAPMSMQIARKVVDFFHQPHPADPAMEKLSPREHQVLALLAQGKFYKEIAAELGIAMTTLRTHQQRIYEKLHVQSRTEATVKYLRRGGGG